MPTHSTRAGVRLLLAAVASCALLVACSSSGAGTPEPTSAGSSALLPTSPTALPSFDPQQFQSLLTSLHGEPVVVNVWASWCGPCTQEAPHLAQVSQEFDGKAQFLGVDILDTRPPAQAFIQTYGWTYP